MLNVCLRCGLYRADKIIDPTGPTAICPECGHKHPFLQLPLLIISGASGAGKSTICQSLLGKFREAVLLDCDILWRPEFEEKYRDFFETWLRLCKNIAQSMRPVVLFGAGMGVPENLEACIERRYFSVVHYLALVCEDVILVERLRQRPAWRDNTPAFIASQVAFNRWFKLYTANPPIDLLDTTNVSPQSTTAQVAAWIRRKIS